jgi:lysophospholipase L1-like esterase
MTDLHLLPTPRLGAQLQGAPWRRVVALGDSIAEGVREPHEGYLDLSWIDRIARSLRVVVRGLCVTNLGMRDLRAAEVRERQLPAALGFRPDLAIVAAGGNDALRRSFAPELVAHELDGIVGPLRRFGADVLMIELMDIVASGLVPAENGGPLGERMAPSPRSRARWRTATARCSSRCAITRPPPIPACTAATAST